MRHITKACYAGPSVRSDDALVTNVNNNNASAAASPELISPESTMPEVSTPEMSSHSATADNKGMAGEHTSSAGESFSPAHITSDAAKASETEDSTVSADLSSAGYVIAVSTDSE